MSLRKVVEKVVAGMKEDPAMLVSTGAMRWLVMLETALDATEGDQTPVGPARPGKASDEVRKQFSEQSAALQQAIAREASGFSTAELTGTPGDDGKVPTMIEIDPSMPVGARMAIDYKVYRLGDDRKLHYEGPVS